MSDVAATLASAREELARGDVAGARRRAQALARTAASPAHRAQAHLVLAACAQRTREFDDGLANARAALALDASNAVAHYVLAELLESTRDVSGAIDSLQRALALDASFVQAWFYLGILRGEQGDASGAAQAFEAAVRLDPRHARAWNNLGNAMRNLRRLDDAKRAFEQAVAAKPDYPLAVANLAQILRDTGEVQEAERVLRAALAQPSPNPPYRPLLVMLAGLTRERGWLDESAQLYWRAIQAAPRESAGEWFSLGWVLAERGDAKQAHDAYVNAYALDRRELRALFGQNLTLPMVYDRVEALDRAREAYSEGLTELEASIDSAVNGLTAEQVLDGLRWSNFFLAYQGLDDRELQKRYADLAGRGVTRRAPQWRERMTGAAVQGRRIRIGFASAFLHVGTVGRYFQSWMTELPRERFELFVYHLWPGMDDIAVAIRDRADHFQTFGGSDARPSIVAPAIRRDALDILVYPELGMDVSTFALAALRLAPRQYAAWGHPVTTGHATIDAFISCSTMEPDGAAAHYVEPLELLPGIGTRYVRPDVPQDASRAEFDLPHDRTLFLCPQSLFKIHPDNDALLTDVLDRIGDAMLVLFAGRHPAVTDRFMQRFSTTLAARGIDARQRVRVLPQLGHDDFMRVNRVCDAMLDTLHWSGGNTSIDALACALPVITLPGTYMRGRQSAAMLGLMGAEELIAHDREQYLTLASRIADDVAWRDGLRQRLHDAQSRLFGRGEALQHLFAMFEREASKAV